MIASARGAKPQRNTRRRPKGRFFVFVQMLMLLRESLSSSFPLFKKWSKTSRGRPAGLRSTRLTVLNPFGIFHGLFRRERDGTSQMRDTALRAQAPKKMTTSEHESKGSFSSLQVGARHGGGQVVCHPVRERDGVGAGAHALFGSFLSLGQKGTEEIRVQPSP